MDSKDFFKLPWKEAKEYIETQSKNDIDKLVSYAYGYMHNNEEDVDEEDEEIYRAEQYIKDREETQGR